MARKRFDDSNCSVARALNEVGDWWSLLVVLHAMYGTRRFVDFQKELGIARNILCDRLSRLVDNQVLKKVEVGEHGSRCEYRLTEKGRDLFPIVVALRQWGQKYGAEVVENPVLVDERDRLPIGPTSILSHDGRILGPADLYLVDRSKLGVRADGTFAEAGETPDRGEVVDFTRARKGRSAA